MAGLTNDCHTTQYGVPDDGLYLVAYPVGANAQLYGGAVALLSGSGSVSTGYLKNAAAPGTADTVVGIIDGPAGGTQVATGAGVLGGSTDGAVWVNVRRGTFFMQNASGGSALSEATAVTTVYYLGENANGPIASATGKGTYPVLGVQLPQDPGIAGTCSPGSSYYPIKLNVTSGS
jgi:hypothetical protein